MKQINNRKACKDCEYLTHSLQRLTLRLFLFFASLFVYTAGAAQDADNTRTPAAAIYAQLGAPSTLASLSFEKIFSTEGRLRWAAHAGVGLNYDTLSDNNQVFLNVPLGVALHIPVTNNDALQIITGLNATFGGKTLYKTHYILSGAVGLRYYFKQVLFLQTTYNPHITKIYEYWGYVGLFSPEKERLKQWSPIGFGIGIYFNERE